MYSPSGRILIVDDEVTAREFTHAALQGEGHEVVEAEDGTAGMRKLATERIDVVILDYVMPGLSGLQVLEGLRGRWSPIELPVIMATGRDSREDIIRALNTGANDYVVKPFDGEILLARVRTQMRVKRLAELRTQFAELASHDLRGLLTILRGGAAALKFAVPPGRVMSNTAYGLLNNVHDNAVQLQALLEDFLKVKGMQEAHLGVSQAFSINEAAEQLSHLYGPYAAQKGVEVSTEIDPTEPIAYADPKLIRQVLQNLVDNAVKFGPPGTHVRIRVRREDGKVRAEVVDDGPGIPPQDLADLFIKGKPLSNRPTGGEQSTHIGLPLCKYYLQMHGTDLEVRNNPGAGSSFGFVLPLAEPVG